MKLKSILASVLTAACSFCVLTAQAEAISWDTFLNNQLDEQGKMTADAEVNVGGTLSLSQAINLDTYTLKLNGVTAISGSGAFTGAAGSILKIDVTADIKATSPFLNGDSKFVKLGSKTLTLPANSSFSGGLEIVEGKISTSTYGKNNKPYGQPIAVTVDKNGIFDMHGCVSYADGQVVLNGGTIDNGYTSSSGSFNPSIVLLSNSKLATSKAITIGSPINLGTCTLTVAPAAALTWQPASIANGTVYLNSGNFTLGTNVGMPAAGGTPTANLDLGANANIAGSFTYSVKNLTMAEGALVAGPIHVYGTYKPASAKAYMPTMQDGSMLDLSGLEAPIEVDPAVFPENAIITIDIGTRNPGNDYLITWKTGSEVASGHSFRVSSNGVLLEGTTAEFDAGGIKVATTDMVVDHAVWTGAVDSDFNNVKNWQCFTKLGTLIEEAQMTKDTPVIFSGTLKNFSLFTGNTIPYNDVTFENLKLASDADFSGFDFSSWPDNWKRPDNWTIDVDTFELTLTGSEVCPIAFTSTATENAGGVRWVVPEEETMTSDWLNLTGAAKFIKGGPGSYSAEDETLPFSGGFVIEQGLVSYEGTAKSLSTVAPFGAKKEITINQKGALDPKGSANWSAHTIVLNGGTISNTVMEYGIGPNSDSVSDSAGSSSAKRLFNPAIQLQASSTLATSEYFNFWGAITPSDGAVLTLAIAAGKQLIWNPSAVGDTTVKVVDGGALRVLAKFPVNAPEMTLVMENGGLHLGSYGSNYGDLTVGGYTAQSTCGNTANATLRVGKVFTPIADTFFQKMIFNDGITLDLSSRQSAWILPNLSVDPFSDCSTVTIDLGERQPQGGEKLVSWTVRPQVDTFGLKGLYAKKSLIVTDDGITYGIPGGVAVWTGGAGDGDLTNEANWFDKYVPTEEVEVQFNGELRNMRISSGQTLACKSVVFNNVTLGENADFSWLDFDKVTEDSVIDVMAHTLTLPKLTATTCAATITDSIGGGIVEMVVEEGDTFRNETLNFTGKVKIVKKGAGTFVGVRDLTNDGGFEVMEGKITPENEKKNLTKLTPFGKGSITLDVGTILDPLGGYDWNGYTINLNGGLITNTVAQAGLSNNGMTAVKDYVFDPTIDLWQESTIAIGEDYNFWGKIVSTNDCELKVSIAPGKYFTWYPAKTENLKLNVVSGGWFRTPKYPITSAQQTNLVFTCNAAICMNYTTSGTGNTGGMDVLDYTSLYTENYNDGNAKINVYGKFRTAGAYFHGCQMMDGSTIVTPETGYLNIQSSSSSDGSKLLTFADNATITIDCSVRSQLRTRTRVVGWTDETKPANLNVIHFKADNKTFAKGYTVVVEDDGVHLKKQTAYGIDTDDENIQQIINTFLGDKKEFNNIETINNWLNKDVGAGYKLKDAIILGFPVEAKNTCAMPYLKADGGALADPGTITFKFGNVNPMTDMANITYTIESADTLDAPNWEEATKGNLDGSDTTATADLPKPEAGESAVKYFKVRFDVSEKAK